MQLSIIIPTFNRSALLVECVAAFIHEICNSTELVIVDDASTDDTEAAVQKLKQIAGCNHIRYERLFRNRGAQIARNRGIEIARGEMVMFCDSDDVLVPAGVKELTNALQQNPDLDFAYGIVKDTDAGLQPLAGKTSGRLYSNGDAEIAGYHWHTMGAVYRASFLRMVGPWNAALTGSQDWEFQARVKLASQKRIFVPVNVGLHRQHSGHRVGTSEFRLDYAVSVLRSCEAVYLHARNAGRSSRKLRSRLAKKVILHSLNLGANGHREERNAGFELAARICSIKSCWIFMFIHILRLSPVCVDIRLQRQLREIRKKKER